VPLRVALLAACLSILALAADDITSVAQDPALLTQYVETHGKVDFAPLERALRVANPEISLPRCDSDDCHAELVAVPGTKPEQVIVWVSERLHQTAFWLRYESDKSGEWRAPVAHTVVGKYFDPDFRLTPVSGRPFFVAVGLGVSGTGLSTKVESWFDLSLERTEPVFTFISEGDHSATCSLCFVETVKATATTARKDDSEQVRVTSTVAFETDTGESLGRRTVTSVYVRQKSGEYKLAPAQSGAPIPDIGTITNEQFLRFDMANLRKLAAEPQSPAAQWLKSFLETCKDTPDKSELLRLLH
jgi:hypothetical protein